MKILFTVGLILLCQKVWARPEYAVREKINCILCHVSPYGGGHRRVFGKIYGSNEMPTAKTSDSDLYYADLRAAEYVRAVKSNREVRGGLGLMTAEAGVNVPIFEASSELKRDFDTNVVAAHDLGSFAPGSRNVYILTSKGGKLDFINSFLIGRFFSPFGLLTDEHRTYTKMATVSKFNTDFEMGMMVSGNVNDDLHYDFALTNGFTNGGFADQKQETIGTTFNGRWNPSGLPFLLGTSFKYVNVKDKQDKSENNQQSPYAFSLYSVFDFYELSEQKVPLSIQGEFTQAKHWNSTAINANIAKYFAPSSTYQAAIKRSTSQSYFLLLKYDFSNEWQFLMKYDHLLLDKRYKADAHELYGIGLRYQFNANMNLQLRAEKATVNRQDLEAAHTNFDDIFLIFRIWI